MSQYNSSGTKTYLTNAAIAEHLLMKFVAGVWGLCGAGERPLASNFGGYAASGAPATGLLFNECGTRKGVAAGTITAGDVLYSAASGKISGDAVGRPIGIALEDAVANDVFEYYGDLATSPTLDVGTLAAAGSAQNDAAAIVSTITTVSAADGTKGVILPAAIAGAQFQVYNLHASNGLKIYPASGGDINDGTSNAAITIEGKTVALFTALDTTTWACTFTVNT